jgi:hypothetical protein
MKKKSAKSSTRAAAPELTDDDIRDYAYHLYEQRGGEAGHDLDDWLEARACLLSSVPRHRAHARLHLHVTQPYPDLAVEEADEARHMNS